MGYATIEEAIDRVREGSFVIVVDEEGDWGLRVRQGKGRKDRLVPLAAGMREDLRMWLCAGG